MNLLDMGTEWKAVSPDADVFEDLVRRMWRPDDRIISTGKIQF